MLGGKGGPVITHTPITVSLTWVGRRGGLIFYRVNFLEGEKQCLEIASPKCHLQCVDSLSILIKIIHQMHGGPTS